MNEGKTLFNGHAAIFMRIASLAFQGLIVVGVFWVGATFERKSDFESYRREQEAKEVEHLKTEYTRSELLTRLEERLRAMQDQKKP